MENIKQLAKKWTSGSFWPTFFVALGLAIIFTLSVVYNTNKEIDTLFGDDMKTAYMENFGCEINNYELSCNEDYIEVSEIIVIDINNEVSGYLVGMYTFEKEGVYMSDQYMSYYEILGPDEGSFSFDDIESVLFMVKPIMSIGLLLVLTPVMLGFYLLIPYLHGFAVKYLVESRISRKLTNREIQRMGVMTLVPFVVINGISRVLFGITPITFIANYLVFTLIFAILIFYALYFVVFTYLVKDNEDEIYEVNTDEFINYEE